MEQVRALAPMDDPLSKLPFVHETLSTLRYASRAKFIKNKPKINEDPKVLHAGRGCLPAHTHNRAQRERSSVC